MARCLRCGAGNEWIQGKVPNEPKESAQPQTMKKSITTRKHDRLKRKVRSRRPKIVKEPTFIQLMLAAIVMYEQWDDVKAVGYSDEEIQDGINFVKAKMDANEKRSNAPVHPQE